jgi:hypothetical protein
VAVFSVFDKFVDTELLLPAKPAVAAKEPTKSSQGKKAAPAAGRAAKATTPAAPPPSTPAPSARSSLPVDLIRQAIDEASDDSGWAPLANVGSDMTKVKPDFDPRLYGHKKLSELLRRASEFVVEERPGPGSGKSFYVRAA